MRIRHSVVVITGASSGVGRATAHAVARRGAIVVLAARGGEALAATAEEVRARGGEPLAVPLDVSDADAVTALADRVVDRYGRIDAWINSAVVSAFGPLENMPIADVRRVLDVNVLGTVHAARAVLPHLRRRGAGVLVNVSSVLGLIAQPNNGPYCMSKAAVRALGGCLRQELRLSGAHGIHVCTVLPAALDTPLWEHTANYTGRQVRALPPVYSPERVAAAIVALLRRPRPEVIVGPAGRATAWAQRLAPTAAESLLAAYTRRTMLGRSEPARPTQGNLYTATPGPGAVSGPYHARARTALRRLATAAAVTGAIAATATLSRRRAAVR